MAAILEISYIFQPFESQQCSFVIVRIIETLNIHKKSKLNVFIEYDDHIGLRSLADGHLGRHL